ncbi:MAG TPA: DUF4190 domain-containing protein [Opitutaceae bacterium]|nr:DUF4190 domain-containing protein [Opitutaceae bacterium]
MYHFAVNGVQQGPVSEAELLSKIARGEVSASDLCWSAGWPQWRRVGEVFPSSAGAVPPLLPPEQSLRAEVVPGGKPKRSGLAVASLICGICTLLLFPLFFLFMIPAIVCGHVAQARIKQAKGALMGGGMALAGLIMGYSGIVMVPVVGLVAAVAFPAFNKVRVSSISKTMDNDARQIAGAAQQYFMEYGVESVEFSYDPATGEVSGPLAVYVKQIGKGYMIVPEELTLEGTFELAHPSVPESREYNAEGLRQ